MPQVFSPQAQQINDLSVIVFAIAALIFVGVEGALVLIVWRFRATRHPRPATFTGNDRLEIAWTAAPALVLVAIFIMMMGAVNSISAAPANAMTVQVTGWRWFWEFRYANGAVTANELHLPLGRPVDLQLGSADVIHSFWVPQLSGKRDAVPKQTNHLVITPQQTGVFRGACAEFCGTQHAGMLIAVVVEPPERFDAWLAAQRADAAAPSGAARQGEQVFMGSTCVVCHTIRGTGASGTAGPDLTHLASRSTIAGGVVPNDEQHLRQWVSDAGSLKPGALMPRFTLPEDQLAALVAYLRGLR